MSIRYDATRYSIVVYCDCGWSDVLSNRQAARSAAVGHEKGAHPNRWQVRDAQRIRQTRQKQEADRNVRIRGDDEGHGD